MVSPITFFSVVQQTKSCCATVQVHTNSLQILTYNANRVLPCFHSAEFDSQYTTCLASLISYTRKTCPSQLSLLVVLSLIARSNFSRPVCTLADLLILELVLPRSTRYLSLKRVMCSFQFLVVSPNVTYKTGQTSVCVPCAVSTLSKP